jgi:hypothetical protein
MVTEKLSALFDVTSLGELLELVQEERDQEGVRTILESATSNERSRQCVGEADSLETYGRNHQYRIRTINKFAFNALITWLDYWWRRDRNRDRIGIDGQDKLPAVLRDREAREAFPDDCASFDGGNEDLGLPPPSPPRAPSPEEPSEPEPMPPPPRRISPEERAPIPLLRRPLSQLQQQNLLRLEEGKRQAELRAAMLARDLPPRVREAVAAVPPPRYPVLRIPLRDREIAAEAAAAERERLLRLIREGPKYPPLYLRR